MTVTDNQLQCLARAFNSPRPNSGRNIRRELVLKERDLIFQQQLALFQALQLKLIMYRTRGQCIDREIKVAVLHAQLDNPALNGDYRFS